MKKPYIVNYSEEGTLNTNHILYYDNKTQLNYLNNELSIKAIDFGPDKTTITETIENFDHDEQYLIGPDRTHTTFVIENADTDEFVFGPVSKVSTRSIENLDDDDFLI
ncbi:hypothetical protein [Lysinibacillus sp. NPDC093692]|uniref:hypothetical protein n=1 Tax=Lysinibacillus sp. NPDC093692 TaxID=3390578 RepID=UPI003D06A03D